MAKIYKQVLLNESCVPTRSSLGLSLCDVVTIDVLRGLFLNSGFSRGMNCSLGAFIVVEELWGEAMELSRSADKQLSFRASWALEWAYRIKPESVEAKFGEFLVDWLSSNNQSVLRVYSKMLCCMQRRGAIVLTNEQAMAVVDKCFYLLTDDHAAVAVKAWQIELLADLSSRAEWIEESLTDIVLRISQAADCTPALATSSRYYLWRIKRCK